MKAPWKKCKTCGSKPKHHYHHEGAEYYWCEKCQKYIIKVVVDEELENEQINEIKI